VARSPRDLAARSPEALALGVVKCRGAEVWVGRVAEYNVGPRGRRLDTCFLETEPAFRRILASRGFREQEGETRQFNLRDRE
jgi:hypothetical protein